MSKVTRLNLEDGQIGERRRLHLHDIQDDSAEPRGSVGSELRAARIARGEDIQHVATALRIRRVHLEAIEGGEESKLPGRPYAIGFVRSYAEYLGLDASDLVARYKAETATEEQPASELVFPEGEDEARMPRGWLLVVALLVAAGLYGGWMLATSADRMASERAEGGDEAPRARVVPAEPEPAPPPSLGIVRPAPVNRTAEEGDVPAATGEAESESVVEGETAEAPAEGEAAPAAADTESAETENAGADTAEATPAEGEAAAPAEEAADAPSETAAAGAGEEDQISALETGSDHPAWEGFVYGQQNHDSRIFLRVREQTWLRVEDGSGNVLISRTLRAGESYRAPNRSGMVLASRNAGAVEIYVDGTSVGRAGSPGEVIVDMPLDASKLSGQ